MNPIEISRKYLSNYRGLPKNCYRAITLTFLDALAGGIVFFLAIYFVDILHINILTVGVLMSGYGIGTVAGGLVGGYLAEKSSLKYLSAASLLSESFTFFILANNSNVHAIFIILFILGTSAYMFKTSNNLWMLRNCSDLPELQLKSLNFYRVSLNLGFFCAGILIGLLEKEMLYYCLMISSIVLMMSGTYLLLMQDNEKQVTLDNTSCKYIGNKNSIYYLSLLLVAVFFLGIIVSQLGSTYPIYIERSFPILGMKGISILFILDTVLIVCLQAPLLNWLNKFNRISILSIGILCIALSMLLLAKPFVFSCAIVSAILFSIGEMICFPLLQLMFYENTDNHRKGQSFGLYQAIYALSLVSGPIFGGYVYAYNEKLLWYICAAIALFYLLFGTPLLRKVSHQIPNNQ